MSTRHIQTLRRLGLSVPFALAACVPSGGEEARPRGSTIGVATGADSQAGEEAFPNPALPEQPREFAAQASLVLGALRELGYDTSTGEHDSATNKTVYLTPLSPEADLPTVLLSIDWGAEIPPGDITPTETAEADGVELHAFGQSDGTRGGVWFVCSGMLATLRADLDIAELASVAVEIHREGCG